MRSASLLGEPITIAAVAFAGALLSYHSSRLDITRGFVAALTANILCAVLKLLTRRARPRTAYAAHMRFKTYSFPSGHSFGSFTLYGFLVYLAITNAPLLAAAVITALGGLLISLIGLSRVYLGAHFPSDVVGGWTLAFFTLVAIASRVN